MNKWVHLSHRGQRSCVCLSLSVTTSALNNQTRAPRYRWKVLHLFGTARTHTHTRLYTLTNVDRSAGILKNYCLVFLLHPSRFWLFLFTPVRPSFHLCSVVHQRQRRDQAGVHGQVEGGPPGQRGDRQLPAVLGRDGLHQRRADQSILQVQCRVPLLHWSMATNEYATHHQVSHSTSSRSDPPLPGSLCSSPLWRRTIIWLSTYSRASSVTITADCCIWLSVMFL